jgi:hypothetical protein
MAHIEMQREDPRPQPHKGHRLLDVTAIGELPRKMLCLDCKMEYVVPVPMRDRAWMERAL